MIKQPSVREQIAYVGKNLDMMLKADKSEERYGSSHINYMMSRLQYLKEIDKFCEYTGADIDVYADSSVVTNEYEYHSNEAYHHEITFLTSNARLVILLDDSIDKEVNLVLCYLHMKELQFGKYEEDWETLEQTMQEVNDELVRMIENREVV